MLLRCGIFITVGVYYIYIDILEIPYLCNNHNIKYYRNLYINILMLGMCTHCQHYRFAYQCNIRQ